MKAAQINSYGGQASLKIVVDAPEPSVGESQVLVKAYAASLNPFDWKLREGSFKDYIKLKFPATLGGDVAGIIEQVGEGVKGFRAGQEVFGQAGAASGQGSLAEYVPVKAEQLALKPDSLDFLQAAALPLAATSAYQALVEHIELKPGQKVLIQGGAGGIGSMAIQIAKNIGAEVATTVSSDDTEFAKNLGADTIVDYQNQNFAGMLSNYDAVFDMVGGDTNSQSYRVLKPGGILVSMTTEPDQSLMDQYKVKAIHQSSKATGERLRAIRQLVDRGKLKVKIDKKYSLDDSAQGLEYLKTGHPKGKVVISIN